VWGFWSAKSKFRFWHLIDPDVIRTVDFFTRESPTRNIERKNIFRETPVEVRSFDGTYSSYMLCSVQVQARQAFAIFLMLIDRRMVSVT
jgi:hypothetical protein